MTHDYRLLPGVTLGGRYRLDENISRGGTAEVWRGTDEVLGRTVAVKALSSAVRHQPGYDEQFRSEARTLAVINHPGVVDAIDYGVDNRLAFLILEYVEGEPLSRTLRGVGRLAPARTMALTAQAADALQAVHDNGIVHRDISPDHLLVRPNGTLVVIDFFAAQSSPVQALTVAGAFRGTPTYVSPEQVAGLAATPASDVYALGVVAYQCLAGHVPFTGATAYEVGGKHLTETPRPLSGDIAPAVAAVVERAMAKEAERRWPSAAAFADAARQVAASLTTVPAKVVARAKVPVILSRPGALSTAASRADLREAAERVTEVHTEIPSVPGSVPEAEARIADPVFAPSRYRLPDRRTSTAVLIGSASFEDEELEDFPAVVNNVNDLAETLADPEFGGFSADRIHRFIDPRDDLPRRVADALDEGSDTVLIYYAGHGLLRDHDGLLHLALSTTRRSRPEATAMRYPLLRSLALSSRSTNCVVILDCCFSGRAVPGTMSGDLVKGQLDITGTYILTSTDSYSASIARPGDRYTEFSGELLRLLRSGLPSGNELLPIRDLFDPLHNRLSRRAMPTPTQLNTQTVVNLALTRNPGYGGGA